MFKPRSVHRMRLLGLLVMGALLGALAPTATAAAQPVLFCNGLAVTVDLTAGDVPTDGDDVVYGTPGDDVIATGAGDDVVCGLAGNDTIWGQTGNDFLIGGDGDDKLRGGPGIDQLLGQGGADDLAGGPDTDLVDGGPGDDLRVRGGTGDDVVDGGDGDDLLLAGNGGSDQVFGGPGDDKITGGPRPDFLVGNDGNDRVLGHKGADQIYGLSGDDELIGGPQADFLDGGMGVDSCHGGTTGGDAFESDEARACEIEIAIETVLPGVSVGIAYDVSRTGSPFDVAAAVGIDRVVAELDAQVTEATPQDQADRLTVIADLAESADLVIAVGFLYSDAVRAIGPSHPDVDFVVIDDAMIDFDTGLPFGQNMAGFVFAEEEGSFLAGAAAALKSKTGRIGFIGGVSGFGLIEKYEAGFVAGARAVDPDIEIMTQYLSAAPDFEGFNSPELAETAALGFYETGADVIFHAAGGAGLGVFSAAKAHSETSGTKVWGIGSAIDEYASAPTEVRDHVLTSMIKRIDAAVIRAVTDHALQEFSPGMTTLGMVEGGVDYSRSGGFVDDIAPTLDIYKALIADGTISVPTVPIG